MTFIPGSHIHGLVPYKASEPGEKNVLNLTVTGPAEKWAKAGSPQSRVILSAGQCSLHSDLLLHASGPNRSDSPRVGLAMSFHPPDVRSFLPFPGKPQGFGWLCRGVDHAGYWEEKPARPLVDKIPRNMPSAAPSSATSKM